MTNHNIIVTAPGVGTVASLKKAAGEDNYVYANLRNLENFPSAAEFLSFLDKVAIHAAEGQAVTIIMDEVIALTGNSKAQELILILYVWGNQNPTLPVTINWVVSTGASQLVAQDIVKALIHLV